MDFEINYKFEEPYIPYRCRKPRYRKTMAKTTISITCAEYPVHKRSDGRGG